jgi:hypothetical protein
MTKDKRSSFVIRRSSFAAKNLAHFSQHPIGRGFLARNMLIGVLRRMIMPTTKIIVPENSFTFSNERVTRLTRRGTVVDINQRIVIYHDPTTSFHSASLVQVGFRARKVFCYRRRNLLHELCHAHFARPSTRRSCSSHNFFSATRLSHRSASCSRSYAYGSPNSPRSNRVMNWS